MTGNRQVYFSEWCKQKRLKKAEKPSENVGTVRIRNP